ncbi:DUF1187 family protein [Photorhabdus heterorhabditis]|uniref:DUF1187 family protein n=1 Tax=Photorhabdus heterorhabditis TaxID=880156 RepID=UPI001BD5C074|nr:DUF1187 family protein [Photorhabdus heterorhabditis]MBS9442469.1 DUF1187 family protein [Photorhabdus heterorhabditis]
MIKGKYIISATITKAGGLPVNWMRYSDKRLSKTECLKMIGGKRRVFNNVLEEEVRVELSHFSCKRVNKGGLDGS